jgi:hypothetical protein
MTDRLTPARFAELADAYGGVIARWPEDVRADARALAEQPEMQALLAKADWLDAQLDDWRVAAPSTALRNRITASRWIPLSRRARLWWSSLGIAAALAGAAAGAVTASAAVPFDHALADDTTAFGDVAQQEN